jgi:integrase
VARRPEGTVFKKVNRTTGAVTYVASLEIGRTATGNRIRPTKSAKTYNEAQKLLRDMIAKHENGQLAVKKGDTVESLGLYWAREIKARQVRQSTATDYEARLRRDVFPYLGRKRIQDLSGRDVERWMNTLYVQGKSVSTINGARRVLFQLCKYASRQELMMFNPVSKTDPLKQDPKKSNVQEHWDREEAKRALESSVGTPLDLFVHLAIFTGMRRGEVLGLKWSDIDLNEGTLSVERTLKEERILTPEGIGSTHLVTGDPKTVSGFRKLAIQGPLVNAFIRHKESQVALKASAGEAWVETDFVLTSSVGTPWNPSNLSTRFRKFLKDNNLRRIRIHDMRHTAAHLSLEGDVRLEAVSQALGHSRIEITKNTYARKVPKLAIDFSNGLAEYLSPVDDALAQLMIKPDGNEFSEETLNGTPKR